MRRSLFQRILEPKQIERFDSDLEIKLAVTVFIVGQADEHAILRRLD